MEKITMEWVIGHTFYDDRIETYVLKQHFPDSIHSVIPESIGMYTGFKTKFGEKLYNGDIISMDDGQMVRYIDWENGMFVARIIDCDYIRSGIIPMSLHYYLNKYECDFIETMYERGLRESD